jgi:hypothetical protein
MNRTALYVAVACAALAGAVLAGTGGAQQQTRPTGTLDLVSLPRDTDLRFVDNPPRGGPERPPSAGDILTLVETVRDTSNRRVGVVRSMLISTGGRRLNLLGSATFSLADGTITTQGFIEERGPRDDTDIVAITGGTGAYEDAGGTLTVTDRRGRTTRHFDFSD